MRQAGAGLAKGAMSVWPIVGVGRRRGLRRQPPGILITQRDSRFGQRGRHTSTGTTDSYEILASAPSIIIEEIWAEIFDVNQSTISRYISFLTPLIDKATAEFRPSADEAAEATRGAIALVDGTLWPCWSWVGERELWAGKYKTTGHGSLIITNPPDRITLRDMPEAQAADGIVPSDLGVNEVTVFIQARPFDHFPRA